MPVFETFFGMVSTGATDLRAQRQNAAKSQPGKAGQKPNNTDKLEASSANERKKPRAVKKNVDHYSGNV